MSLRAFKNGNMAELSLILTVFAVLFASVAQANQFKRIRDVNVSCNNALLCDLYITNPRVTLYSFGFRRSAIGRVGSLSTTAHQAASCETRTPELQTPNRAPPIAGRIKGQAD